ncbi:hypothetical protein FKW77_001262 [Venturia effusa]|uniref:N-acetyltransferase domain-containing protein n=1 Tax=Venturia effusa TaxID=50376 RepID=A0A517L4U8_9PEZI|nr:hypothetical protein FKW77_001262 [Venturia effusa]
MSGAKKRRLSGAFTGVQQSKMTPQATALLPSAPRPHRPPSHFTIEVRCPSKIKSKRNNWKPPLTMEEIAAGYAACTVSDNEDNSIDEEEGGTLNDSNDEGEVEDLLDANDYEFQHFDWLEPLNGKATLIPPGGIEAEHKHAGRGFGELIRRDRMRYAFYDQLEQPSEDTSRLAFGLFDRYGRLREEFKSHQIKKGSGVWGSELDVGDLLLIEKVYIEPDYRRQGLAQKVVRAMIEEARPKCGTFFAVVLATAFNYYVNAECSATGEERDIVYCRQEQIAQRFFRSLGFRRVGSTDFFALPGDKHHACHKIAAQDDYNPPDFPRYQVIPQIAAILERAGPLQIPHTDGFWSNFVTTERPRSLTNLDEQQWGQFMSLFSNLPLDHQLWGPLDCEGNTILHIAAMRFSHQDVASFLKEIPKLASTRNYHGETPTEALNRHLEEQRTTKSWGMKISCVSDQFRGFGDNTVKTLMELKGLTHTTPIDEARLKYGCTCGQCLEGFFSPRMRFALICQAEMLHDMLNDIIPQLRKEDWNDGFFEMWHGDNFRYLDPGVRENLKTNKSMRQGFVNLFSHFATCSNKNGAQCVPSPANVMKAVNQTNEWPPYTRHFMERGGTTFPVGSVVFQEAKNQASWAGDGTHDDDFKDDIAPLPKCRNDYEFGFVRGMCGY